MKNLLELEQEVLNLPLEQRISLLNKVLSSSEPNLESSVQNNWDLEIARRISLVDENKTERFSADEVFKDIDSKF